VSRKFSERRFQTIASGSCIETSVEIRLCRDREDARCQALEPEALVVIGAPIVVANAGEGIGQEIAQERFPSDSCRSSK
jgi:hypothetical protein